MASFLERAIKKGIRQGVSNTVGKAVSNAVGGAINSAVGGAANGAFSAPRFCSSCGGRLGEGKFCPSCGAPVMAAQAPVPQNRPRTPGVDLRTELDALIAASFPAVNVQRNVQAAELGFPVAGPARPYDYVLFNGRIACAIMVTDHNRDNNAAFKNAKAACLGAGVPFLNFYTHMPNERNYVVNRIGAAVR